MGIDSKPPLEENDPRERGQREYFLYRGQYRNPYESGSAKYNAYERGWMQSLKRNDGKLVGSVTKLCW